MTAILDFHHVILVLNRFKINQKQTKLAKFFFNLSNEQEKKKEPRSRKYASIAIGR